MATKRSTNSIIAVAFAFALLLCGGAQASSLFGSGEEGRGTERSVTLLDHAATWLLDTWSGFKSIVGFDETPTPATQSCPQSGCSESGDAGIGIDPEG